MKGVDISATGQGVVDFDALRGQVDFVFSKSSEGTGFIDPQFAHNWSETKRVGLGRGAYHFVVPDLGTIATDEATFFLSQLGPLDDTDMLALDYERTWNGDVVGWCKQWLDVVFTATGRRAFVYLNLSTVRQYDWQRVVDAGYPLWLADYDGVEGESPVTQWPTVAIKQWTSSGHLDGIGGLVDLDTEFGGEGMPSETQIREWAKEEARVVLAKEYGPALEVELVQRIAEGVAAGKAPNIDDLAAAVEARIAAKLTQ